MEAEKSFAKSFLNSLSQKPIRYRDDYSLGLSSLSQIPPEVIWVYMLKIFDKKKMYQQRFQLPERCRERSCVDRKGCFLLIF